MDNGVWCLWMAVTCSNCLCVDDTSGCMRMCVWRKPVDVEQCTRVERKEW